MNKAWKVQEPKKPFKYLRIGSTAYKHLVFELTPENILNILVGNQDRRILSLKLNNEAKRMLRKFINDNNIGELE